MEELAPLRTAKTRKGDGTRIKGNEKRDRDDEEMWRRRRGGGEEVDDAAIMMMTKAVMRKVPDHPHNEPDLSFPLLLRVHGGTMR